MWRPHTPLDHRPRSLEHVVNKQDLQLHLQHKHARSQGQQGARRVRLGGRDEGAFLGAARRRNTRENRHCSTSLFTTCPKMESCTNNMNHTRHEQEASAGTKSRRGRTQASTGVDDLPLCNVIRLVRSGASLDDRHTEEATAKREAARSLDEPVCRRQFDIGRSYGDQVLESGKKKREDHPPPAAPM
ncbi:hypothetical protein ON010_g14126 [Phytophthora cinnamomi]|nr:hypothetical protein ON010_g14126 [Phytophthora cinnamomi]